jgi:hypothetical protein
MTTVGARPVGGIESLLDRTRRDSAVPVWETAGLPAKGQPIDVDARLPQLVRCGRLGLDRQRARLHAGSSDELPSGGCDVMTIRCRRRVLACWARIRRKVREGAGLAPANQRAPASLDRVGLSHGPKLDEAIARAGVAEQLSPDAARHLAPVHSASSSPSTHELLLVPGRYGPDSVGVWLAYCRPFCRWRTSIIGPAESPQPGCGNSGPVGRVGRLPASTSRPRPRGPNASRRERNLTRAGRFTAARGGQVCYFYTEF